MIARSFATVLSMVAVTVVLSGVRPAPSAQRADDKPSSTLLIPKVPPDGKYLFLQRKVDGNTDIYWVDARVLEPLRPKAQQ